MSMLTINSPAVTRSTRDSSLLALARCRRALNRWVAAYLALQERRATARVLHGLNDRELTDIGISRSPSAAPAIDTLKRQIATM